MFDKFGEFDSAEEINKAAAGQRTERDMEALITLCRENGIDVEDAEDYMDGTLEELVNPFMAAIGKLKVEVEEMRPYGIMNDWIEYIRSRCMANNEVAVGVRKKGKSLKGCIGKLLKYSFENCKTVDSDICKIAGVPVSCKLGIPDMGEAKKIITEYYTR